MLGQADAAFNANMSTRYLKFSCSRVVSFVIKSVVKGTHSDVCLTFLVVPNPHLMDEVLEST